VGSSKLLVLLLLCSTLVVQSSFRTPRGDSWDEESSHAADVADREDTGGKKTEEIQYRADFEDDEDSEAELLVQQAARGALEPAQVDRYLVKTALAQLGSEARAASMCEQWVDGEQIASASACNGYCITSDIDGEQESKCDVDGLCGGTFDGQDDMRASGSITSGYGEVHRAVGQNGRRLLGRNPDADSYDPNWRENRVPNKLSFYEHKLGNGECGTFPGMGGARLYCSISTPADGRVPKDKQCPRISLLNHPDRGPPRYKKRRERYYNDPALSRSSGTRVSSVACTTMLVMLAAVGYMA